MVDQSGLRKGVGVGVLTLSGDDGVDIMTLGTKKISVEGGTLDIDLDKSLEIDVAEDSHVLSSKSVRIQGGSSSLDSEHSTGGGISLIVPNTQTIMMRAGAYDFQHQGGSGNFPKANLFKVGDLHSTVADPSDTSAALLKISEGSPFETKSAVLAQTFSESSRRPTARRRFCLLNG